MTSDSSYTGGASTVTSDECLVVEPEGLPQDNFKGPEFRLILRSKVATQRKKKSHFAIQSRAPSILSDHIITCTSCLRQINPFALNEVFEHPVLHVLLCKSCNDYYHSGEFDKDDEGIDNYCRWCGDGGTVTVCENCTYVFCRVCIRRHVSRNEYTRIKEENWLCFACNPKPIVDEMKKCREVMQAMQKYRLKKNNSHFTRRKTNKVKVECEESTSDSSHALEDEKQTEETKLPTKNAPILKEPKREKSVIRSLSVSSHSTQNEVLTPKVPIQTWRTQYMVKLQDISQTLQCLSKELQSRLEDNAEENNHTKTSTQKNFQKVKTLEDLKSSTSKVFSQMSVLQKTFNDVTTKFRSLYGKEYEDFDDANSTTAKESDSDSVIIVSPTKKKHLRKRKVLDNSRLSSSNENESPKKLPRKCSDLRTSDNTELEEGGFPVDMQGVLIKTEILSSPELSDTGSSKVFRKKSFEAWDSVGSLSDIFERQRSLDKNSKKKLSFENVKGKENSGNDSESLIAKSATKLDSKNKDELDDVDATSKSKSAAKHKRLDDFDSNASSLSASDLASDDQILPSQDDPLFRDPTQSDSNSMNLDAGMANEKNKIALENLKNQRLQDEEEDDSFVDEDVKILLENDEKKKGAPTAQEQPPDNANSDKDASDSEKKEKKKSSYLNPLLKVRINSSGSDDDNKVKPGKRKRAEPMEISAKRTKTELVCDEALKDSNLSDEDVLLLNSKDDDLVLDDIKQSDSDVLLSEDERGRKSEKKKNDNVDTKDDALPPSKSPEAGDMKEGDKDPDASEELCEIQEEKSDKIKEEDEECEDKEESSDTDSDMPSFNLNKPKKKKQSKIHHFFKDDDASSGDDFADSSSSKTIRKKRRRKVISDSENEDALIEVNDSPSEDESHCFEAGKLGRRNIRKIIDDTKLSQDTRAAEKIEMERRKRLEQSLDDSEVIIIDDDPSSVEKKAARLLLSRSPLIEVDSSVVKVLKDHQIEGIKFLWRNVIENVTRANKAKGDGCILAHCMGLGKTLQVVAFLHTVLTNVHLPGLTSALVICPLGTVSNWVSEFRNWLKRCKTEIRVYEFDKSTHDTAISLKGWQRRGGVVVMSYAKYRSVCQGKSKKMSKNYQEMFRTTLQDPGPDIVVCDEGHVLKNEKTDLSSIVDRIKSKRRIVLTGTPLQNNLIEYHCMVSFIKPRLLGSKKEFINRFVNPILNGQHVDSTRLDVHLMKKRSHVLHELLAGCIERKDVDCLRAHLTPKLEYVLFVRLSPLQIRLYEYYIKTFNCNDFQGRKGKLFQDFNYFLLIACHPRMLLLSKARQEIQDKAKEESAEMRRFVLEDDDDDDEDISTSETEEAANEKNSITSESLNDMSVSELKKLIKENGGDFIHCIDKKDLIERAKKALNLNKDQNSEEKKSWFDSVLPTQDELIKAVEHSGKMLLLLEILRLAAEMKDKVVVFSQSILTLDLIEIVLKEKSREASSSDLRWRKEIDYFRMDGSTCRKKRSIFIDRFNAKSNKQARLFLISTKAGGIGINLVGANRAVLFDASWNPTHDVQSIFRIYRFGQEKPCYIYRLIAQGTMEEKIYDRQVVKQSLAFRVVDEQQIERHFTANDIAELYSFKPKKLLKKSQENETPDQAPPKDILLADLLRQITTRDSIVSYHQHDSLLDHQVNEELSEEDRRTAWDEYDRERRPPVKDGDPLMRLQASNLSRLLDATKDEMKRNSSMLEKCKERPLSDIMLNLKIQNRDLNLEKLQQHAIEVLLFNTKLKTRLENTRRILIEKSEQIRYCLQRKAAAALPRLPAPPVTTPNTRAPNNTAPRGNPSHATRPRPPQAQYVYNNRPNYTNANPRFATYQQRYSNASRFPRYPYNARPQF